jgi:hypothetical protein
MLARLRSILDIYRDGARLDWWVVGANILGAAVVTLAFFHAQDQPWGSVALQVASAGH